jgi:hypothetical protein
MTGCKKSQRSGFTGSKLFYTRDAHVDKHRFGIGAIQCDIYAEWLKGNSSKLFYTRDAHVDKHRVGIGDSM